MKWLCGVLVAALLAVGLAGCGDDDPSGDADAVVVPSVAGVAGPDAVAALCEEGFAVAVTQIHDPTLDRASAAGESQPGAGELNDLGDPVGLTVITRSERELNLAAPQGCEASIVASEDSGIPGGSYSPR